MRSKPAILTSLLLIILVCVPALAQTTAQSPGPGMVPAGQWQVSLSSTWLAHERFQDTTEFSKEDGETDSEASQSPKMRDDRMHLVTLSYGPHPRLTLFGQAGLAEGGVLSETLSNGLWEAKLKPVFIWGLGARGLVWQDSGGLGITAGLNYLRYDDRGIDHWHQGSTGWTTDSTGVGVDAEVDYWRVQADVLAHWRLGRFLPYLGLGYAYSELKDTDTWSRPDSSSSTYDLSTKGQDHWGLLGGVQAELCYGLSLGLNFAYLLREEVGLSLTWLF